MHVIKLHNLRILRQFSRLLTGIWHQYRLQKSITIEFFIQALEVNVPPPNVSVGGAQAVLVRNPVTVAQVQPASVAPEIIQQPQNHTVQIHPVSNIVPQPPANTVTTLIPPTNNAVVKQRLSPMPVQSVAGMLTNPSFVHNLMHRFYQPQGWSRDG